MGCAEGRGAVTLADGIRATGLRFAVTGATGWLGRAAAEVLAAALGEDEARRRLTLFASRDTTLPLDAGFALSVRPLADLREQPHDVLLHYAYLTRERIAELGLDAYVRANVAITATVLDAIDRHRPQALVMASSGAVYEAGGALATDLEGNPYGTLKHLDELALRRATADVDARSLILRVFNVAGPWILKPEAFAISDLIAQIRDGAGVEIRATRSVLRSYVDVEDLAAVAIASSLDETGPRDLCCDTAGDEIVEVGELAARIAGVLDVPLGTPRRTLEPAASPDNYVGDGAALADLATRLGIAMRDLDDQIGRTADAVARHGHRSSAP